jgi:hypothetical protein
LELELVGDPTTITTSHCGARTLSFYFGPLMVGKRARRASTTRAASPTDSVVWVT